MTTGTNNNDILTGDSGNNTIYGYDGDDLLEGLGGNDILIGGPGIDTMVGGTGNDRYYVDSIDDIVTELAGEGNDRVESSVSYWIPDNVETLVLTGTDNINAYGNDEDNRLNGNNANNVLYGFDGADIIYGFGGNDILVGGPGRDFLLGGDGDDRYYVDHSNDRILSESSTGGYDRVFSTVDYTLPDHVEFLALEGSSNLNGTGGSTDNSFIGNSGDNVISGNDGNDIIRGGDGNDTLIGGDGDDYFEGGGGFDILQGGDGGDRYTIDDASDTIIELAGDTGTDTIRSFVDTTIADNVERLALLGTATSATGNNDGQTIVGNHANNIITGLGGADTLEGSLGDDTFVFGSGFGADTIVDFTGAGGPGGDLLDVTAFGWDNLLDMKAAPGVVFSGDTIDFGGGDSITLTGIADVNTLTDDDFLF